MSVGGFAETTRVKERLKWHGASMMKVWLGRYFSAKMFCDCFTRQKPRCSFVSDRTNHRIIWKQILLTLVWFCDLQCVTILMWFCDLRYFTKPHNRSVIFTYTMFYKASQPLRDIFKTEAKHRLSLVPDCANCRMIWNQNLLTPSPFAILWFAVFYNPFVNPLAPCDLQCFTTLLWTA